MDDKVFITAQEIRDGVNIRWRQDNKYFNERVSFKNYFFILFDDFQDNADLQKYCCKNFEKGSEFFAANGHYIKCYFKDNFNRNYLRKFMENNFGITLYEADINAVKHWLIENQDIDLHQEQLHIGFFDIETDDRKQLQRDLRGNVIANSAILSYALKDKNDNIIYNYNKARDIKNFTQEDLEREEKILIEQMFLHLNTFDLVHAYNGYGFDFTFIKTRAEYHDVGTALLNNFQAADYMIIYKKYIYKSLKSWSLQNVSKDAFKKQIAENKGDMTEVTKIDWKEKTGCKKIFELYSTNKEVLKEYNIQDINLMTMLEKQVKFDELSFVLSELSHTPYITTIWNSHSFDYAMLNKYYQRKLVAPSKPSKEEVEKRKKIHLGGGYTYCFKPGLHSLF